MTIILEYFSCNTTRDKPENFGEEQFVDIFVEAVIATAKTIAVVVIKVRNYSRKQQRKAIGFFERLVDP